MDRKMRSDFIGRALPFYRELSAEQRARLDEALIEKSLPRGAMLARGGQECAGMVLVAQGCLRAFVSAQNGKEITLYRLFELDACVVSASCVFKNLTLDLSLEAEEDTLLFIIPPAEYEYLINSCPAAKAYAFEILSARFSEAVWVLEQFVSQGLGRRLAEYLIQLRANSAGDVLKTTHEQIARDMGSAREVITRALGHLRADGIVELSRGRIIIKDFSRLLKYAQQ